MRKMKSTDGLLAVLISVAVVGGCMHAGEKGSRASGVADVAKDSFEKPGFYTELDSKDGRLWVFKTGSEDLAAFKEKGRPAKHALRPGAGPGGVTVKSTESETIVEYIVARSGFYTVLDKDGRLWVFREGSDELKSFKEKGKPAKHVVRPGAGPLGLTVRAVDVETINEYLADF